MHKVTEAAFLPLQHIAANLRLEDLEEFSAARGEGFDAICTNAWNVQASLDPALDGASSQPWDQWCVLNGPTTLLGRIPVQSRSTHVQMQITCAASGPATFSKLFVHYSPGDTD